MTLTSEERQEVIRSFGKEYGLRLFIETGSGDGYTAEAVAPDFDRIITIEVSPRKYYGVWGRLVRFPHVLPILGDSAEVLPHLLNNVHDSALFWLDGHYDGGDSGRGSEDTPIREELRIIFGYAGGRSNVILVDDARLFGTDPAYPSIDWITGRVRMWSKDTYGVHVADDIIRILPLD